MRRWLDTPIIIWEYDDWCLGYIRVFQPTSGKQKAQLSLCSAWTAWCNHFLRNMLAFFWALSHQSSAECIVFHGLEVQSKSYTLSATFSSFANSRILNFPTVIGHLGTPFKLQQPQLAKKSSFLGGFFTPVRVEPSYDVMSEEVSCLLDTFLDSGLWIPAWEAQELWYKVAPKTS